jgi:GST-like protein
MASYPWIVPHKAQGQDMADFSNLKRWFATVAARPATGRAYERGKALNTVPTVTEESKAILFGQDAEQKAA